MAAPALAKITLDNNQVYDLHAKVRVLLVDDDHRFLKSAQSFLEDDLGCTVDAVTETEAAVRCLQDDSYHVVITDLNFDPPHDRLQGTQFIVDNIAHMGNAKVVAVTGQAYYAFKASPELKRLGVELLDKGQDNFLEEITNITAGKVEEQRQAVSELLQDALSEIAPEAGVDIRTKGNVTAEASSMYASPRFRKRPSTSIEHLYKELERTLTQWLKPSLTGTKKHSRSARAIFPSTK